MYLPGLTLGYHGCDRSVGEKILAGESLLPSENDYDWLGNGIYFWEHNPERALHWATLVAKTPAISRNKVTQPFVIGAIIDMGNCLDLMNAGELQNLKRCYDQFEQLMRNSDEPLPKNEPGHKNDPDRVKRKLDCAVINFTHDLREADGLQPSDTVRAPFTEGGALFTGSMIMSQTHIQIAVRNPKCIKGYFRPMNS